MNDIKEELKRTGILPLELEDIKPGMQICFENTRAYASKVKSVDGENITIEKMTFKYRSGEIFNCPN